jgi:glycerophosphoryl diester phosphodiesterase
MPSSKWALLDRWLAPAPDGVRVAWLRNVAYAHRGWHGPDAVENSPTAFAAALEAGLGIECDVRPSADGRAIVFHDRDLDRLTGQTGPLARRTAEELTGIALLGSADGITTLRDTLALIAGRVPLLIELKSERGRPISPLCRAVAEDLERYGGRHAVMSFDPRIGAWFAARSPATVRGLVVSEAGERSRRGALKRRLSLWRAKPDFLAYDVRDLPSPFAAAQRARGLPLLTWTVTDTEQWERARMQADGFIVEGEGLASARPKP